LASSFLQFATLPSKAPNEALQAPSPPPPQATSKGNSPATAKDLAYRLNLFMVWTAKVNGSKRQTVWQAYSANYSQAGCVMSMFSGYFKPVSLKISTAAPMTPPASKLPAMAQVGMGMAETVKR